MQLSCMGVILCMLLVFAVDEITGHAEDSAVFPLGQIASLGQDSAPEPLSEHEVTDAFSGTCGDGKRTSSEECEDGNTNSGDGCDSSCKIEKGFQCTGGGEFDMCESICGDGLVRDQEQCDDENSEARDGCSPQCQVENGFTCDGAPSKCTAVCGDGLVNGEENCDDGNNEPDDGCSDTCEIEEGWQCGSVKHGDTFEKRDKVAEEEGTPIISMIMSQGSCKPVCGDGLVKGTEECDDKNLLGSDGCTSDCKIEAGWACKPSEDTLEPGSKCHQIKCGDGHKDEPEHCDDGNEAEGDGCSSTCQVEFGYHCGDDSGSDECYPVCGDGVKLPQEACDDGNRANLDGCSKTCQIDGGFWCDDPADGASKCTRIECGDGLLTVPEICDDGNTEDGDGCNSQCENEPGWKCVSEPALHELGQVKMMFSGKSECSAVCGDAKIVPHVEDCDDGNAVSGDGCSMQCKLEGGFVCNSVNLPCKLIVCGDGEVDAPIEECDDGDTVPGDGCDISCKIEAGWKCFSGDDGSQCDAICGDGIKTGDEECDDFNQEDGDGCNHLCQLEPSCGDGKLADDEECDLKGVDGCSVECKVDVGWKCDQDEKTCEALCGDGVIAVSSRSGAAAEECDDANTYINDGCNAACKVEDGWKCQGVGGESCSTVCGDGLLKDVEQCDDKNTAPGDGCDENCALEDGWDCGPEGDKCATVCGDGIVSPSTEDCDDQNTTPGDGCSAQCKREEGWECATAGQACTPKCGDSIKMPDEDCDDGNGLDEDGCSSECKVEDGWECDAEVGAKQEKTNCERICGNGKHERDEGCDDGNRVDGDGCSAECAIEPEFYCEPDQGVDVCRPVVNCDVGSWSDWSECTAECNGGHKLRSRQVTTVSSPGGATCPALSESRECNTEGCVAVDCSLSEWTEFNNCTAQCAGGHQVRSRTIVDEAKHNGVTCGSLTEQRACNTEACPVRVDCAVEEWTAWSPCNKKCDGGTAQHERSVWKHPTTDGTPCPSLNEQRECNTQGCPPPDCQMGEWGNWGVCDRECGSGNSARSRAIIVPAGEGGLGCGLVEDQRRCNTQPCAPPNVDCRLGGWALWTECDKECGGGNRDRQRVILVQPQNAGASCGELVEHEECHSQQCPQEDCVMAAWSVYSECDKKCGGGISERKRTILEEPSTNGVQCGSVLEQRACATQPCMGKAAIQAARRKARQAKNAARRKASQARNAARKECRKECKKECKKKKCKKGDQECKDKRKECKQACKPMCEEAHAAPAPAPAPAEEAEPAAAR